MTTSHKPYARAFFTGEFRDPTLEASFRDHCLMAYRRPLTIVGLVTAGIIPLSIVMDATRFWSSEPALFYQLLACRLGCSLLFLFMAASVRRARTLEAAARSCGVTYAAFLAVTAVVMLLYVPHIDHSDVQVWFSAFTVAMILTPFSVRWSLLYGALPLATATGLHVFVFHTEPYDFARISLLLVTLGTMAVGVALRRQHSRRREYALSHEQERATAELERENQARRLAESLLQDRKAQLEQLVRERTAELERSERRHRTLFEAATDSILLIAGGRIIDCNPTTLEVFGCKRGDLVGSELERFVPPTQRDGSRSAEMLDVRMASTLAGTPQYFRCSQQRLDGSAIETDMSLSRMELGERPHILAIVRDVTDRIRMEEMVVHSDKMHALGGLTAGMAHEINNPLAGIIQNVQVVRNRLSPSLEKNRDVATACGTTMEVIAEYANQRALDGMLDVAVESGKRAAQIVSDMLAYGRPGESAKSTRELTELLDKSVELASSDFDLKKHYDFRRIEIAREYEAVEMPCDAGKLQQVFLNLLRNGAEAMAEAATEKPSFTLRVKRQADTARIEVEDNGPGIPDDVRRRVFEPFFTTKAVGVGTGLGLSVSYFIITEDHGGTMSVESAPGQGTTFVIELPCPPQEERT